MLTFLRQKVRRQCRSDPDKPETESVHQGFSPTLTPIYNIPTVLRSFNCFLLRPCFAASFVLEAQDILHYLLLLEKRNVYFKSLNYT